MIPCTGFGEPLNGNRTLLPGMKGFLKKPVTLHDLADAVCKILGHAAQ